MQEILQELRLLIRGMLRYRWVAMAVVWICCLLGWVGVYTMPNIYEARAKVYVDAESRLAKVMGQVGASPGVGTQVFVVQQAMLARPQLEKVAKETGIITRAHNKEEREKLLVDLQNNIVVSTGYRNETRNLYTITFQDQDREMSVAVVQKLLDTFVNDVLHLKEQGSEQVDSYLDEQLKHYSDQLSDAESKLADFKKEYVGLLPGETGGVFDRLQDEMNGLKKLQQELQTELDRREELRRQLATVNPYLPDNATGSAGAGVPGSSTEATIKDLEKRRADLLLTYTDRHPDVVAIDEQLKLLYDKRTQERQALQKSGTGVEGIANATNPVYQNAQIALNQSSVLIAGLRSQLEQRQATVRKLNEQVNSIPEIEAKYAKLTRDYGKFESLYDEIMIRKERERMGKAGEERDVVSFNIIEPPEAPLDPVAPRRALYLIGVFILSLGAGATTAFVLHQVHPVFHDVQTLRQVSRQPVLGAISLTWLEKYRHTRRAGMTSFLLVGCSLLALFAVTLVFQDVGLGLVNTVKASIGG